MKQKLLIISFIFFFSATIGFSQLPARLDSSFLTIGEFWDGYLNQYQSIVSSAALPDSTLVYVAQITGGTGPSAMIKLKHDGTIDSTFGTSGKMTYTIAGAAPTVKEIHLYKSKLYLSGKVGRDKFVTRINLNGTVDNTFGTSGTRTITYGTPIVDITNSFAIDTSGNCYVGARFTNLTTSTTELSVTKINASGNIVTSFGVSGRTSFTLPTGAISSFSDLAIDNSQRIVAAACGSNTGNNVVLLVKFNQNGSLYTGFNSTGYKEWTFTGADNFQVATNEILTDNDNIIVAGEYLMTGNPKGFIFKLKSNGDYDSTFATNGVLLYANGSYLVTFSEAAFASDRSILLSGSAGIGIASHISLLKIKPNGAIDSVFATNGMFLNQVGTRWETNGAECMSIYTDDRVFLGGNSSDCDGGTCYFTSSMSRVNYGEDVVINDTTQNDTTSHTFIANNLDNNFQVKLYPNPIIEGGVLSFKSSEKIERVIIQSINGQILFENTTKMNSFDLPETMVSGIYFVSFYSNGNKITKKIVVNG